MKNLAPCTTLLYSDTDSFILLCEHNWYNKMRQIQSDFDFSEFPLRNLLSTGLTEEEIKKGKGVIGAYKSEINKESIFVGFISLQKKAYCLLILKPVHVKGNRTYYTLTDSPTAKRLKANNLTFKNYIQALDIHEIQTQNNWKFTHKNKNIHLTLEKHLALSSFDHSNYTKSCGFHNIFFSKENSKHFLCQICENGGKNKSFVMLKENLRRMQKGLFYIEEGKLIFVKNCRGSYP